MLRARYLIPFALFAGIAVFLGIGLSLDADEVPSPLIGKPMPEFRLATVADPQRSIGPKDFEGRVWLLNVWATWCTACRQEHPVLMRAARENGLTIVGLDYKDGRAAAIDWLDRLGNPYVVSAFDPDGRVGIDLGVYGVPETYVVGPDGVIHYKHIGPVSQQALDEKIVPLVEELSRGS